MRVVIQRVRNASVHIQQQATASIGQGLLILLGIEHEDTQEDIDWMCRKIIKLRIFSDEEGLMNHSLASVDGEVIIVSQFTLHANTRKGTRPSFVKAAKPDVAIPLYENFIKTFESLLGKKVQTGEFGADMQIDLCNDGPVTIVIDSKQKDL